MTISADDCLGFEGKTAMVWGGGAGIGAATAKLLAGLGASVAVVDRDLALAEQVAAELNRGQPPGRTIAKAIECDVRSEASINRAVDMATEALGHPTLSACVVGISAWADLVDMTVETWDDQLALNLRPMFLIGRKIARVLRDAELGGSLVFVGSIAGEQGAARHAAYGVAKAGMVSLAKTMALEWGPLGIRVNCVAPGPIATARIVPTPQMEALLLRKLPAGRFGKVEEIASALALALSDMARFMTGETLRIDGGWMAAPPISPDDNPSIGSRDKS